MNEIAQNANQNPGHKKRRVEMTVRPTGPILPPSNIQGNALLVVIAIMAFLACLTLGGVSMVRATASSWQSQISREITIQITPEDGLDMGAALVKARDLALTFVGTRDGQIMDDSATARLLEPWLGTGLNLEDLPVPRLIVITIDESNPPDFEAMRALLKVEVPQAFLDDHRTWVDRLVQMANTTVLIGSGILILVFTAMVLTVIFATRGALSGNRHIIEVLHFVGAEGSFVAQEFQ
jgi:cell division transport system permease protein